MTSHFHSESAEEHRRQSPAGVCCAVVTVSDTRTIENDRSGQAMIDLLQAAGHTVVERAIVPDDPIPMRNTVLDFVHSEKVDAVLLTGGTGIAARDQTPETLSELFTKDLPGYGELLRMLSYQEIGPASLLSRAVGGLIEKKVVLTMPGSTAAVQLAMEKIILPELAHLVGQAGR